MASGAVLALLCYLLVIYRPVHAPEAH
jgi:hypothetical protein